MTVSTASAVCAWCERPLRTAESIAAGYGPVCAKALGITVSKPRAVRRPRPVAISDGVAVGQTTIPLPAQQLRLPAATEPAARTPCPACGAPVAYWVDGHPSRHWAPTAPRSLGHPPCLGRSVEDVVAALPGLE